MYAYEYFSVCDIHTYIHHMDLTAVAKIVQYVIQPPPFSVHTL